MFLQRTNIRRSWPRRPSHFCCAKSNQKALPCHQKCFIAAQALSHNQAKPRAAPSFPTDRSRMAYASESAAMPLPLHNPPPFCLILAEAVLLTARGHRFFTCLLKNLSLRGASQGLRLGCDAAIARHAFRPASLASLKSLNRVPKSCLSRVSP